LTVVAWTIPNTATISPSLTANQIYDLAADPRDVLGNNMSRKGVDDKLLMFIEDVPGYESREAPSSLI
jgi:hypothetical protein